jgi:hypothetical protein
MAFEDFSEEGNHGSIVTSGIAAYGDSDPVSTWASAGPAGRQIPNATLTPGCSGSLVFRCGRSEGCLLKELKAHHSDATMEHTHHYKESLQRALAQLKDGRPEQSIQPLQSAQK